MHAKLVVGGTAKNIYQGIRDICRLLTSPNPSISDLSGEGFSTTSSAILDNTPAGWTYVGSSKTTDQSSIGSGTDDATFNTTSAEVWACKSPMLNSSTRYKYACFTQNNISATTPASYAGALFGAQFVSETGVVTGPSYYYQTISAGASGNASQANPSMAANIVLHLVATPRGIVLVREGAGFSAVLETSTTDVHEFYNIPAFLAFSNPDGASAAISTTGPSSSGTRFSVQTFGITDPNTGVYYSVYDTTVNGTLNSFNAYQNGVGRGMSQDEVSMPQYLVSPVYVHNHIVGYPVQYVSGIFPIYWCRSQIGSTGDTLTIGDEEYKFFNCGSNTAKYGLLLQTS